MNDHVVTPGDVLVINLPSHHHGGDVSRKEGSRPAVAVSMPKGIITSW